jgi:acetyl esterase/lipase
MRSSVVFALTLAAFGSFAAAQDRTQAESAVRKLMTPSDLQSLPSNAADHRLPYGTDANQFGELRVPSGPGLHPVVVLVHGGCWRADFATLRDLGPMGDALKKDGIATWNIEYRRLGLAGGGWPGTYLDVGHAIDQLRELSGKYHLDLSRVVVVGHSAGGHLAMWAAIRARTPKGSAIYVANPLPIRGVVNLAGTIDMSQNVSHMTDECREPVVSEMLGGTPESVALHYKQVSANAMLPLRIPQTLIWGEYDDIVPQPLAQQYVTLATKAGDKVQLIVVPAVGHFETPSPFSSAWPTVEKAIRSLLTN